MLRLLSKGCVGIANAYVAYVSNYQVHPSLILINCLVNISNMLVERNLLLSQILSLLDMQGPDKPAGNKERW